jgi:hypothetical protein
MTLVVRRTVATGIIPTRTGASRPSHSGPQTSIGVMLGGVRAKRRKIANLCARRPAGRDILKGPNEVHGRDRTSRLFA